MGLIKKVDLKIKKNPSTFFIADIKQGRLIGQSPSAI